MSTNSPPPESAAEVLDLNADAAVVDVPEAAGVAAAVGEETMAAAPEAEIDPSIPVEVALDRRGEVLPGEQLGETVSEAELAAAEPPRENTDGVAMLAGKLANGESDRDRKAETEVVMDTGTKTSMEQSEVAVEDVDLAKADASPSLGMDPAGGTVIERNVVAPDLNTIVEPEVDERDASFGDETIAEVLPENPLVGASISDPGMNSPLPLQTSGNGNCRDGLLDDTGQTLEDHGISAEMRTDGDQIEEKLLEEEDKSVLKSMDPDDTAEVSKHVSYDLALEDKPSFSVSDLVWGKVKSHPWWPGQIFDPLNASDMARKHQKKENLLVAYFGDKTFAWCDETKLKPFYGCFSQLANQSSSETFVVAIDNALAEVSRRVELSMSSNCIPEQVFSNLKLQKIDNAGIKEGSFVTALGSFSFADNFQPSKFLDYLKALTLYPGEVIDRLELAIAKAQTIAFNRFRGKTEVFVSGDHGRLSIDEDKVDSEFREVKRRSGLQGIPEHGRKMHCDDVENGMNSSERSLSTSSNEHNDDDFAFDIPGKSKKKKLDALSDLEVKNPTAGKSFKVGECISRVASKLTGSQTFIKCNGENLRKGGSVNRVFEVCSHATEDYERMKEGNFLKNFPSPEEMLSQLTIAARDQIEGHSFLSTVVPFFTEIRELRDSVVDEPLVNIKKRRGRKKKTEIFNDNADESPDMDESMEKIPKKRGRKKKSESIYGNPSHLTNETGEKIKKKRGRKKKSDLKEDPKTEDQVVSTVDYMTDSYWTDGIACTSPEEKPSSGRQKRREKLVKSTTAKKTKILQEPLPLSKMMEKAHHLRINAVSPGKHDSTVFFGDKRLEDSIPTALIMSFNESSDIPSETNLIRIFSRYGPLKEAETEVIRGTKSAKVVFKRRADAETAFSSAGKYRIFGPALISFRLKSPPSSVSSPQPSTNDQLQDETKEPAREHAEETAQKQSAEEEEGKEPECLQREEEGKEPENLLLEEEVKEPESLLREEECKEPEIILRGEEVVESAQEGPEDMEQ